MGWKVELANAEMDRERWKPNLNHLAAIDRSGMDVTDDGPGWLLVTAEGNALLRVHESRVIHAPKAPEWNQLRVASQ